MLGVRSSTGSRAGEAFSGFKTPNFKSILSRFISLSATASKTYSPEIELPKFKTLGLIPDLGTPWLKTPALTSLKKLIEDIFRELIYEKGQLYFAQEKPPLIDPKLNENSNTPGVQSDPERSYPQESTNNTGDTPPPLDPIEKVKEAFRNIIWKNCIRGCSPHHLPGYWDLHKPLPEEELLHPGKTCTHFCKFCLDNLDSPRTQSDSNPPTTQDTGNITNSYEKSENIIDPTKTQANKLTTQRHEHSTWDHQLNNSTDPQPTCQKSSQAPQGPSDHPNNQLSLKKYKEIIDILKKINSCIEKQEINLTKRHQSPSTWPPLNEITELFMAKKQETSLNFLPATISCDSLIQSFDFLIQNYQKIILAIIAQEAETYSNGFYHYQLGLNPKIKFELWVELVETSKLYWDLIKALEKPYTILQPIPAPNFHILFLEWLRALHSLIAKDPLRLTDFQKPGTWIYNDHYYKLNSMADTNLGKELNRIFIPLLYILDHTKPSYSPKLTMWLIILDNWPPQLIDPIPNGSKVLKLN